MSAAEQLSLVPGRNPDALVTEAKNRWQPIATVCLFSGGNDSAVLAHRCRDHYDHLLFIDTGTALPGVEDHVCRVAAQLDKPLVVRRAGDAYDEMVLGGRVMSDGRIEEAHGFPGPGHHGKAYSRLKERQIEAELRELKADESRTDTALFLSGIRRSESKRRKKRQPLTERGSAKFVNPLIDWSVHDMRRYRDEHGVAESDVAALLHRSGECNCGAFAEAGSERAMLEALWPEWWEARIGRLERRAKELGIEICIWGGYDLQGNRATEGDDGEEAGPLCACDTLFGDLVAA